MQGLAYKSRFAASPTIRFHSAFARRASGCQSETKFIAQWQRIAPEDVPNYRTGNTRLHLRHWGNVFRRLQGSANNRKGGFRRLHSISNEDRVEKRRRNTLWRLARGLHMTPCWAIDSSHSSPALWTTPLCDLLVKADSIMFARNLATRENRDSFAFQARQMLFPHKLSATCVFDPTCQPRCVRVHVAFHADVAQLVRASKRQLLAMKQWVGG